MEQVDGFGPLLSKMLILGVIGLLFGIIPLAIGLRTWLVREEIVIHSSGGLDKSFILGPLSFGRVSIQPVTSTDFRINTRHGSKTGSNHELTVRSSIDGSEIRLLCLKVRSDAEQWLGRVSSHLAPDLAATRDSSSARWFPAL